MLKMAGFYLFVNVKLTWYSYLEKCAKKVYLSWIVMFIRFTPRPISRLQLYSLHSVRPFVIVYYCQAVNFDRNFNKFINSIIKDMTFPPLILQ